MKFLFNLLKKATYLTAFVVIISVVTPGVIEQVRAVPFNEIGDAGELIGTAQILPGGVTSVNGNLSSGNDEDLFGFNWDGGNLDIEVTAAGFDSQLFVFDGIGEIVGANDDGGVGLLSRLSGILAGGSYYVGISQFNSDPLNAAGTDIEDPLGGGGSAAYQPGVCALSLPDCTLASWRGSSRSGGAYTFTFSSPTAAVPEPTTLALMGLGLFGIAYQLRRKPTR